MSVKTGLVDHDMSWSMAKLTAFMHPICNYGEWPLQIAYHAQLWSLIFRWQGQGRTVQG